LNDFESDLNEYATSSSFITCKLQVTAVCAGDDLPVNQQRQRSAFILIDINAKWLQQRLVTNQRRLCSPSLSLSLLWLRAICCSNAASPDTRLTVPWQQCRVVSTTLCRP